MKSPYGTAGHRQRGSWWSVLLCLLWVGLLQPACGREAAPLAEDEAVERRLVAIAEELRCLVCQNESLAGSQADLAKDLRREIREQIRQGRSDQEILEFMVARYGDFVRYRPPLKGTTLLLWFGPFLLLVIGFAAFVIVLRRRARRTAVVLSEEERQKAEELLRPDSGERAP